MTWIADDRGVPLDLPPSCVGFLVRYRRPGARGSAGTLRDDTGSAALVVPAHATPEQFRDLVHHRPGRYVLTPIGAGQKVLRSVREGVVVVGGEVAEAIGTSALDQVLAAIASVEGRMVARLDAIDARTTRAADELAQVRAQVEQLAADVADVLDVLRSPQVQALAMLLGSRNDPARDAASARAPAKRAPVPGGPPPKAAPPPSAPAAAPAPTATAPTAPPQASSAAPPPTTTAPLPVTDDAVRAVLVQVADRLAPLPRAAFGDDLRASAPWIVEIFRPAVLAAGGDVAMVAEVFGSDAFFEAMIVKAAPHLGVSSDVLRTYWKTRDEHSIPADLLERMRGLRA